MMIISQVLDEVEEDSLEAVSVAQDGEAQGEHHLELMTNTSRPIVSPCYR